jgi:hypothetical protein
MRIIPVHCSIWPAARGKSLIRAGRGAEREKDEQELIETVARGKAARASVIEKHEYSMYTALFGRPREGKITYPGRARGKMGER